MLKKYHGIGGISRGKFFVLQGASNTPDKRLPAIPPITVRGKPTKMNNVSKKMLNRNIEHHKNYSTTYPKPK